MTDIAVLTKAYEYEQDPRRQDGYHRSWEFFALGATKDHVRHLLDDGLICVAAKVLGGTRYVLTAKGRDAVFATTMEQEFARVPASDLMDAMSLVVGFDDIKEALAYAISTRRRTNFLLAGPPACGKSALIEAVRSAVPGAYLAFGSRTSASGLAQELFDHRPPVLLLDELDKMRNDAYSVLLGVMESGEIIETKIGRTRGVKLETMVIAACNSTDKMPPELLSRFDFHALFPTYTRDEFINVCRGYLGRAENMPVELAEMIGERVFDNGLGDIRRARGVWKMMKEPTRAEVERSIAFILKYMPDRDDGHRAVRGRAQSAARRLMV